MRCWQARKAGLGAYNVRYPPFFFNTDQAVFLRRVFDKAEERFSANVKESRRLIGVVQKRQRADRFEIQRHISRLLKSHFFDKVHIALFKKYRIAFYMHGHPSIE